MAEELWAVYDEMAPPYEDHVAAHPYNALYDRPAVLGRIGDVAGKHVLDACCGPGLYVEELLARGARGAAFDASEAMIELTRARVGGRAEVHRAVLASRCRSPQKRST